jgi:hypothetical protein
VQHHHLAAVVIHVIVYAIVVDPQPLLTPEWLLHQLDSRLAHSSGFKGQVLHDPIEEATLIMRQKRFHV